MLRKLNTVNVISYPCINGSIQLHIDLATDQDYVIQDSPKGQKANLKINRAVKKVMTSQNLSQKRLTCNLFTSQSLLARPSCLTSSPSWNVELDSFSFKRFPRYALLGEPVLSESMARSLRQSWWFWGV